MVSATSTVRINITRRAVPANDNDLSNPMSLRAFFIFISECRLQVDCINKIIKRI